MTGWRYFSARVEGHVREVGVLLHARGGEDYRPVVAVAAAAGELPVVALALEDVAETGAYAHDVGDDRGDVVAAEVADALLLEREAGAGGGRERPRAAAGRAEEHIDARYLALGLDELSAHLGHAPGHILEYLRLRGYRVAAEETAAGPYGGFREGLVALHQNLAITFLLNP